MTTQESDSSLVETFPGDSSVGQREFPGGRPSLRWTSWAKKSWDWLRALFRFLVKSLRRFQDRDTPSETGRKHPLGRPTIPDSFLLGARNAWAWLLEQSWPEIGWPLHSIRNRQKSTIEDVRKALMPLKEKPDGGLAAAFYRDSSEPANATEIRKNRVKLSRLAGSRDAEISETQAKRDAQERLCLEAEAALKETSPEARERIQSEADRRKARLAELELSLRKAEGDRDSLDKKLRDQEAYFYPAELLDFLHSRRYAVEPRNLANALAGLLYMQWRQSYSRCSQIPYDSEPHRWYRVFVTIEEIWKHRSAEFVQAPVEFFRAELLRLPKKFGYVRQFLWENWRDLRLAIEECWKANPCASSVPFAITSLFVRNVTQQKRPTDRILAEREKIDD